MKKYFITIVALMAFALSNAMEQRYQNTDRAGQQNQNIQNDQTRHYTLADLRQNLTTSGLELLGSAQPQSGHIDPAHLALFGLQEGYTANQLLNHYNLYECTTAEQTHQRYEAFSALYPYARNDQQQFQQQSEMANFDYENYQLPETYDAMETDSSNSSNTTENANAIENNHFGEIESYPYEITASYDDQWIGQLRDEIEQAIQFGTQDERILHNITACLFGHENYRNVPRNIWFDLPLTPYSRFQEEWQTSITMQSNPDRPDYERLVGAHDSIKGIYTYVSSLKVMYKYDILGRLKLRFRRKQRKFIVTKLNHYYPVNDDDNDPAPNENW